MWRLLYVNFMVNALPTLLLLLLLLLRVPGCRWRSSAGSSKRCGASTTNGDTGQSICLWGGMLLYGQPE
jgi:hypothetical protein